MKTKQKSTPQKNKNQLNSKIHKNNNDEYEYEQYTEEIFDSEQSNNNETNNYNRRNQDQYDEFDQMEQGEILLNEAVQQYNKQSQQDGQQQHQQQENQQQEKNNKKSKSIKKPSKRNNNNKNNKTTKNNKKGGKKKKNQQNQEDQQWNQYQQSQQKNNQFQQQEFEDQDFEDNRKNKKKGNKKSSKNNRNNKNNTNKNNINHQFNLNTEIRNRNQLQHPQFTSNYRQPSTSTSTYTSVAHQPPAIFNPLPFKLTQNNNPSSSISTTQQFPSYNFKFNQFQFPQNINPSNFLLNNNKTSTGLNYVNVSNNNNKHVSNNNNNYEDFYEGAYEQDQDAELYNQFQPINQQINNININNNNHQYNHQGQQYQQNQQQQQQYYQNQQQFEQSSNTSNQNQLFKFNNSDATIKQQNISRYSENSSNFNKGFFNNHNQNNLNSKVKSIKKSPSELAKSIKLKKSTENYLTNSQLQAKIQTKIQHYEQEYQNYTNSQIANNVNNINNNLNNKVTKPAKPTKPIPRLHEQYFQLDLIPRLQIYHSTPQLFQNQHKKSYSIIKLQQQQNQQNNSSHNKDLIKYQDGVILNPIIQNTIMNKLFKGQTIMNNNQLLSFKQIDKNKISPAMLFQKDMALVFSTGSYGIIFARTFFGPNVTHADYHFIMRKIIFNTFRLIEEYLYLSRVKIKLVRATYLVLIKQFMTDFKSILSAKSSSTFKKFIRMTYKITTNQKIPTKQDSIVLYTQIMTILNDKLNKTQKKIRRRIITNVNFWSQAMQYQTCQYFLQSSIQAKNLTVIRNKLLQNHPQISQKQLTQQFMRLKFKQLMRRLIIQIIQKRIQLIKRNPQRYSSSSQTPLPPIRKIDQTKIRIIVNGFDGIQSRVSLIKFHLDPNINNLINTIQQMNKIQIPGIIYQYMDDKILLTVNCLTSKRGRKKKLGESKVSDEESNGGSHGGSHGQSRVKEEFDDMVNNNNRDNQNNQINIKRNKNKNVNYNQMDDQSQDDVESIYDDDQNQQQHKHKKNNKNKSNKKNNKKTSQINPNEIIKQQPIEYQHSAEQMSNCDIENQQMSFLSN